MKIQQIIFSVVLALNFITAYSSFAQSASVSLSGGQEFPPIATSASGKGVIDVAQDYTISGGITVKNIVPTTVHIHEGALGGKGPAIISLEKLGDDIWVVPSGRILTPAEYQKFKNGNLYIEVHSAVYKSGEIRGQIQP